MPGPVVVAEVDRRGLDPPDFLERSAERWDIFHHSIAGVFTLEHLDRPARITGQHRRAFGRIDLDALVALRVPRRRQYPDAGDDLAVSIHELVARARVIEPGRRRVHVAVTTVVLGSLYVQWRLREDGILPAVVEMQVRIDDPADVGR